MADSKEGLFKGLVRLFRSGPIVKRTVKAMANNNASAQSSALDLFKRSQSHVYANAVNSYGSFDRMSRYADFCFHPDTLVYTTKGVYTIKELSEKYGPGERFNVYSYDHLKKEIVIGTAHDPRLARNGEISDLVRVTLDDGGHVDVTPDHKMMLRSGETIKAGDLKPGDALMPLRVTGGGKGYHRVQTMNRTRYKSGWAYQHIFHVEQLVRSLNKGEVVHHKDFNKKNNSLTNLKIMLAADHYKYHAQLNNKHKFGKANDSHGQWMMTNNPVMRNDVSYNKILSVAIETNFSLVETKRLLAIDMNAIKLRLRKHGFKNWQDFADNRVKAQQIETHEQIVTASRRPSIEEIKDAAKKYDTLSEASMALKCTVTMIQRVIAHEKLQSWVELKGKKKANKKKGPKIDTSLTYQMICNAHNEGMTRKELATAVNSTVNKVMTRITNEGFESYSQWMDNYSNHKVVSVERVESSQVYNLTVDGTHNFAGGSQITNSKGNLRYSLIFMFNSEMEYTPEIASALDIYADESVAQDERGQTLHIFSDNPKIRELLGELFYDTLNIEFNLRPWVRNLVKYGDVFLFTDVSPDYGVINVFPVPVNEIEREEGYDPEDPMATRFRWVTQGNQVLENWQIAHMRLLGNDAFLPYGSSVLEPARRIWRQLILIEDAMLVYRVVRSPERRIFYIDVGTVPPDDVPAYMEKAKAKLRSSSVVDKSSGRVDLRHQPVCFDGATGVPLLDGRTVAIKDLCDEWEAGKRDHEVYSLDLARGGHVIPGKVIWAGKTGHVSKMIEVELDDGGIIRVTPDHKLMLRDGNPICAKDLKPDASLMPCYTRLHSLRDKKDEISDKNHYEQIYNPASDEYIFTHRLIAAEKYNIKIKNGGLKMSGKVIHHRNFKKLDNMTENLELMDTREHSRYHALLGRESFIKYNKSPEKRKMLSEKYKGQYRPQLRAYNESELHAEHNVARSQAMQKLWNDPKRRKQVSKNMSYNFDDECFEIMIDLMRSMNEYPSVDRLATTMKNSETFTNHYKEINTHFKRDPVKSIRRDMIRGVVTKRGFKDYRAFVTAFNPSAMGYKFKNKVKLPLKVTNHRVVAVREVDIECDVYNVTVEKNFNLAVQAANMLGCHDGKVVSFQSVDMDYFLPVRGSESGTRIDTLPGGTHVSAVEDVEYTQRKLFAALKVPKAYIGYEEGISSKSTLAQQDVRFSRTINMIQRIVIAELNKVAAIHLYANGYEGEELLDFTLLLSNPSTIAQQQKLELYRSKLEIAALAPELLVDRYYLRKYVLGMTDAEIKKVEAGLKRDREQDAFLESVTAAPDMGGGGGSDMGGGMGGSDLFASQERDDDQLIVAGDEDEPKLLIGHDIESEDDDDDDSEEKITDMPDIPMPSELAPIKADPSAYTKQVGHNARRRRHHGASQTHMPDFKKMLDPTSDEATDIYDRRTLGVDSNPLKSCFGGSFYEHGTNKATPPKTPSYEFNNMLSQVPRLRDTYVLTESDDIINDIDEIEFEYDEEE